MGKKSSGGRAGKKTEIVFDAAKRREYLTGFRKRKAERKKKAQEKMEKAIKEDIRKAKQKARENIQTANSSSHRVVPEIEHLLENNSDVHDLGSHTVSITPISLDGKKDDEKASEDEEEVQVTTNQKTIDNRVKKVSRKTLTKSINKLQGLKRSKPSNKNRKTGGKKTAKSKRLKHHHPMKRTT